MKKFLIAPLIAAVLMATGCGTDTQHQSRQRIQRMDQKLDQINGKLDELLNRR